MRHGQAARGYETGWAGRWKTERALTYPSLAGAAEEWHAWRLVPQPAPPLSREQRKRSGLWSFFTEEPPLGTHCKTEGMICTLSDEDGARHLSQSMGHVAEEGIIGRVAASSWGPRSGR